MIRVETNAGHGAVSLKQQIAVIADKYAFAWDNMGVTPALNIPISKDQIMLASRKLTQYRSSMIAIGYCVSTLGANIIYFKLISDTIILTDYLVFILKFFLRSTPSTVK